MPDVNGQDREELLNHIMAACSMPLKVWISVLKCGMQSHDHVGEDALANTFARIQARDTHLALEAFQHVATGWRFPRREEDGDVHYIFPPIVDDDIPIHERAVPLRLVVTPITLNFLRRAGIKTTTHLTNCDAQTLLGVNGIGPAKLDAIRAGLRRFGLALQDESVEVKLPPPPDVHIDTLGLQTMARNCLVFDGVKTLGDLLKNPEHYYLELNGLGKIGWAGVKERLEALGVEHPWSSFDD